MGRTSLFSPVPKARPTTAVTVNGIQLELEVFSKVTPVSWHGGQGGVGRAGRIGQSGAVGAGSG